MRPAWRSDRQQEATEMSRDLGLNYKAEDVGRYHLGVVYIGPYSKLTWLVAAGQLGSFGEILAPPESP